MSENKEFLLKAEQFNQEEWCEMFRRVSETCKDLRTENECLQNQLQQKENIIKEIREYIEEKEKDDDNWIDYELCIEPIVIKKILDKENKE